MAQSNFNSNNQQVTTPASPALCSPAGVLVVRARGGDESALLDLWMLVEKSAKRLAANSAKAKSTFDPLKAMSKPQMKSAEGISYLWELMMATVFNDDHLRWTGFDKHGAPISFEKHFANMAKFKLNGLRFEQSHSGRYSRRTWKRWWDIVIENSPHGQVDDRAIDIARERVKAKEYAGTKLAISLRTFDQCREDYWGHMDLSIDREQKIETGESVLGSEVLADPMFMFPINSPEGDVAQAAFEGLSQRHQEMFGRANGLFGEKELLADIAADHGITEQRVGQIVSSVRKVLAAAVEDYRFANGLPEYQQ